MNGEKETAPFFIVGCPRSGTTLLQLHLDSHPSISIPPESHIFERYASEYERYGDLKNRSNLTALVKDILTDTIIQGWELDVSVDAFIDHLPEPSFKAIIICLFDFFSKKEGSSRWGDKTPQHALYLPQIRSVIPEAKILHIVRDGRDVAESLNRVYIGPQSILGIAKRWKAYINAVEDFKKAHGLEGFLEIRYEDLVQDPEKTMKEVCHFLDAEFESTILDSKPSERKKFYLDMAPHFGNLNSQVTKGRVGVFKSRFNNREIEIFESIAENELKLHGYTPLTDAKAKITTWEKCRFFFMDYYLRFHRKIFRRKVFKQVCRETKEIIQLKYRKIKNAFRKTS